MEHHTALLIGYSMALTGWFIVHRVRPELWPVRDRIGFEHPWREVLYAVIACAGVIAVGQLYSRGYRLEARGDWHKLVESVNQTLTFAPVLLLLVLRQQAPETAWLPGGRVGWRIAVGLALAAFAVFGFTLARSGSAGWTTALARSFAPGNFHHLVQVFLEDLTIAVLFVRLRAAVGAVVPVVLVAILFAAGHVPALLEGGGDATELLSLFLDAGLGVVVLSVLQRSRDIVWFCWVHFAMDMMQFHGRA